MRDPLLHPFYGDLSGLPGIGPKLRPVLARVIGGETVLDLLFHLPGSWIDRRLRGSIADIPFGEVATVEGEVDHYTAAHGKLPARIRLRDETGFLSLVYFRASPQWLQRTFPLGARIIASGEVTQYQGGRQMMHPDHAGKADGDPPPPIEPVYASGAGLAPKILRRAIAAALDSLPPVAEWIDRHLLEREGWPGFRAALERLHRPADFDMAAVELARARLTYDEAFAREVAMAQARAARERRSAEAIPKALGIERQILEALPFRPTRAQTQAFGEVSRDLALPFPMRRLIQGDVGSGKTLIAALAAAQVGAAGRLTALMSPTEVLARQQAAAMQRFLAPAGMRCVALTGSDKGPARAALLAEISAGKVQVVSGTQALYSQDVDLPDLALIIIDEQHRFGVADRVRLTAKGRAPHMLVMSATPIPRTLSMALHGDMDVSIVAEKPAGRQEVVTAATPDARIGEVMDAVARAVDRGERAFWICPLVDGGPETDDDAENKQPLPSAVSRRDALAEVVRGEVVLVHGRMPAAERDAALDRFRSGAAQVLVGTTVVEVGVDVPEATIIVIERSERFGLAQLHQLRGRVGRGAKPSSCLLLYRAPLTDAGRERIEILRRTTDGFEIAEADYKLRGAGDLLGARQSGAPELRLLDPERHANLILTARSDAKSLLASDPPLFGERGQWARRIRDLLAPRLAAAVTAAEE